MRLAVSRFSSAIALTLDHGKIDTGGRSAPLCEIELELERGDRAELLEVARDLTRTLPAHVALKSKAERGYDLLEDTLWCAGQGCADRNCFGHPPAPIPAFLWALAAGGSS
jgi:inorganic triphosphatase YgiF